LRANCDLNIRKDLLLKDSEFRGRSQDMLVCGCYCDNPTEFELRLIDGVHAYFSMAGNGGTWNSSLVSWQTVSNFHLYLLR